MLYYDENPNNQIIPIRLKNITATEDHEMKNDSSRFWLLSPGETKTLSTNITKGLDLKTDKKVVYIAIYLLLK